MKNTFAFVIALGALAAARGELPRQWEAEAGVVAGRAEKIADAGASGGAALRLALRGRAQWNVSAETAGRYELWLRYRTENNAAFPQFEVNGRARGLGFTSTFGGWHETRLIVPLAAGANTLALEATTTGFDLDTLGFTALPRMQPTPVFELPEISPRQASVDLRAPQPLLFLLRRNGHGEPRLTLDTRPIAATLTAYAPVDDAMHVTIAAEALRGLAAGGHELRAAFADGTSVAVPIDASAASRAAPLLIATLDINHGKATVVRLPDEQVALIDCAKPDYAQSRLIPFLRAHGIKRIDHLFLTHYHDDHAGGREALRAALPIGAMHDYKSYRTGESFTLGGVEWFVLNAYDGGDDENSRSLALQLTYNGFVYTDGADTYAQNQLAILEKFPARVRSDVVYGNHHFHGSVDVNYLRQTDPLLFVVSAEQAVYARAAYADDFKRDVEGYLLAHHGRLRETLLTAEVNHILVRVHDAAHWSYETAPVGAVFPDFAAPPR